MTTAHTTITLTHPVGIDAEDFNVAQSVAREAYHAHTIGSDWECKLIDIIPAEGAKWAVSTQVVVDGDDIGADAGLEDSIMTALRDERVVIVSLVPTVRCEDVMVCQDCLMIIANDDDSGMSEEQAATCRDGVAQWNKDDYYLCAGDSDKGEEFSRDTCDCCGQSLAGSRHHVVALHQPSRNVPTINGPRGPITMDPATNWPVGTESWGSPLDADHQDDITPPESTHDKEFHPQAISEADADWRGVDCGTALHGVPVICPDCGQDITNCLHQFQAGHRSTYRLATVHRGRLPYACGLSLPMSGEAHACWYVIPPVGKVDRDQREPTPYTSNRPRAHAIRDLMFAHGHFPACPLIVTLARIDKHINTRQPNWLADSKGA